MRELDVVSPPCQSQSTIGQEMETSGLHATNGGVPRHLHFLPEPSMFLRLMMLLALAPIGVAAQATPAFTTVGAFVALSVPDLDASATWYAEKLGLRLVLEPPPYQGTRVKVMEGGGLVVELLQNPAAMPLRTAAPAINHTTLVHGIFKAGFVVEDFDRALATLRERGVEVAIGPFPARDGQRANVIIRDNAGNLLQLFGRP